MTQLVTPLELAATRLAEMVDVLVHGYERQGKAVLSDFRAAQLRDAAEKVKQELNR